MTTFPYRHWQTGRAYRVQVVFVAAHIPYQTLRHPDGRFYVTVRVYEDGAP